MTMGIEFRLELHKMRRRGIPLLLFAAFSLISTWILWCLKDLNPTGTNDPSATLFLNLLLMNTILCPVAVAAMASRMCDMEQAGNTYKWLCTIQNPEHIYRGKVITGAFFLAIFNLLQAVLFTVLAAPFEAGLTGRLAGLTLSLYVTLFLTSLCVFMLQLNLSLRFANQLTPLFISIGGTFTGLFSWFLGKWPLRFLIPWGYYAALCNTGYEYNQAARYTTYYWNPYPFFWAAVLISATAVLYRHGQKHFLNTVQETM